MPSIKITGLKELNKKLKKMSKSFKDVKQNILEEVASEGYDKLSKAFDALNGIDGNLAGNTNINISSNIATISQEGKQVGYIEFGTGYIGKKDSHPLAIENNWQYAVGKRIRLSKSNDNKLGWYYYKKGQRIFTEGIPAQRIAWNTSKKLKEFAKEYSSKKVSEVIKNG